MTPEELRAKYEAERVKRLRSDGNEQYLEPVGKFAHYLDDPYVEVEPREPLTDEVTFAFIGVRRHLVLESLPRSHV